MNFEVFRLRESVWVDAPPQTAWERIIDITRMGDASPMCIACQWDRPEVGLERDAWFTGTNRVQDYTYETRCQIDSLVPGSSFTFVNHGLDGSSPSARWGYEVVPSDGGTTIIETWELLPTFADALRAYDPDGDVAHAAAQRMQMMRDGIVATLARLEEELGGGS